jgi:hypothetical protein
MRRVSWRVKRFVILEAHVQGVRQPGTRSLSIDELLRRKWAIAPDALERCGIWAYLSHSLALAATHGGAISKRSHNFKQTAAET